MILTGVRRPVQQVPRLEPLREVPQVVLAGLRPAQVQVQQSLVKEMALAIPPNLVKKVRIRPTKTI
jgi:hypothetical protein